MNPLKKPQKEALRNTTQKYLKTFYIKDYLIVFLGLSLYVFAVRGFLMPYQIVTGGLMGITLLINYATGIPVWIPYIGINSIFVVLAWKVLGWRFVANSIYSIGVLTLLLKVTERFANVPLIDTDPLMAGVIGGALSGVGLGLIISVNSSTGGLDFIAAIVSKYRYISMGRVLMIADIIVVSCSYLIFQQVDKIIYGLIVTTAMYYCVDMVINGVRQSMQFLIFTNKYEEIATHINSEIHRGCSIFDAQGWYTKTPQKVIMVIAKRSDSTPIFRLVKQIDEKAFIIQTNVGKVYGQGFDKIK